MPGMTNDRLELVSFCPSLLLQILSVHYQIGVVPMHNSDPVTANSPVA